MGRAPAFGTLVERYVAEIRTYPQPPAETTIYELSRKLERIGSILSDLEQSGKISTTDPRDFDDTTVGAFLSFMKAKNWSPAYQVKMKEALGKIMSFVENNTLRKLEEKGMVRLNDVPPEIYPKGRLWLQESLQRLESLPDSWPVKVVRFAIQAYFWTMLRTKELRMAKLSDLETRQWTMKVSVPKGQGRWASQNSRIDIVSELRPAFSDFLHDREEMLSEMEIAEAEPLIPTMHGIYYTGTGWSQNRCRVFRSAGIDTHPGDGYRILRPSGANFVKDELNLSLETTSALLRHTNPATTVKFYARMKSVKAWNELERALEAQRQVSPNAP